MLERLIVFFKYIPRNKLIINPTNVITTWRIFPSETIKEAADTEIIIARNEKTFHF